MKCFILRPGLALGPAVVLLTPLLSGPAQAVDDCNFLVDGTTWLLQGDCTTDATIYIPDGYTLDGGGFAITAVDPAAGDHFRGAVVQNENGGTVAHVTRLFVNASGLANVCDPGGVVPDDRLRGIMFDGAEGSITHSTVQDINQGPSGCQEGNAIEVRNAPFDGMHPATQTVEIAHNVIETYQKTGIVCNGDVDCLIHHNVVSESATQENLAANSVQLGYGAFGLIEHNHIAGNQWLGTSDFASSAVLIYLAGMAEVNKNNIGGNADIGIFAIGGNVFADNNRVFESGADQGHYDIGIGDYGTGSSYTNNKVRGYDAPAESDDEEVSGTKVVPAPQDPGAACFLPDSSAQAC